jgi:ABC-type bacteriocin/lantibiotic exporter with double-glycine peptidase domain
MLWKVIAGIFWQYTKEHPFYVFFLNILFIGATIINNIYLPQIYGKLYDMFQDNINTFMYAFIFILLLKSTIYIIYQFEEYFFSIQRLGIEELIQKFILRKITEKYQINPEEIIIGEKLSSLFKIQKTFGMWFSKIFQYLIPYIAVIISSAIYMYSLDKYLPLYLILLFCGSFLSIFTNISFCANECYQANNEYLKLYNIIEDYLSNLLTIHTYNQFDNENTNLHNQSKIYQEANKSIERCALSGHLIGVIIVIIFMFLTMYRCYKLLIEGTIKKSQFMGIYFIIISMLGSLIYLADMFHDLSIEYHNIYNIEKISQLHLFTPFDEQKKILTNPKINTDTLIKFVNVTYSYPGSNQPIIQNLNLDIHTGERIALIGDIGSGKSTVLKLILNLIKPSSGDIFLNEYNYTVLNQQKDIFKKIGYMTQNPILFNRSIIDNILFSNPDITRKEVIELLDKFGLNKVFNKLEKGIDSSVGKNGSKLSGGQKQVIWFLRIYFNNPDILLLDEPTASLSLESKTILWNLIENGFKNKTIIMSSHDEFLIKLATRKVRIGN